MLSACVTRFVDRDMFMRYRGSGIGHKYMQAIEEVYENMSRERTHHQEHRRGQAPSGRDAMDIDHENTSSDEREPEEHLQPQAGQHAHLGTPGPVNTGGEPGTDCDEGDEDHGDHGRGAGGAKEGESDLDSPAISDSDDVDSDGGCEGESYGFGGL